MADSLSSASGDTPPADEGTLLFGRYRVLHELGRGGMGVVLLAHDEELGKSVALKIVPELLVRDTEAINDLKKEVLRGMALLHPGIVRTHNLERDSTSAAIVMEFVDGDTLTEWKTQQPGGCFDAEQLIPWLEQLCPVLDYAHREAHIAHRDLKPRNIMVTRDGKIKVADFGIASSLSENLSRTSVRADASGTPAYMSPQQAMGERASHLDDIYALGATLYELLTGKPPFFRGQILAQVLQSAAPSMAERRAELGVTGKTPIPPEWEQTIAACLAKTRGERPQSAGEVLAWLCAFPTGNEEAGNPDAGSEIVESDGAEMPAAPPRRWRAKWITTVLVFVAGLIALGTYTTREPKSSAGPATAPATPAPVPPAQPSLPSIVSVPPPRGTPVPSTPAPIAMSATPATRAAPAPATPSLIRAGTPESGFTNSLGMKFVPVPGTKVLFGVWPARVQDFEAFVNATGYDATANVYSMHAGPRHNLVLSGDTWKTPGFKQGPTHPICGVSWTDAKAFCEWLTKRERAAGRIRRNDSYRLPTDEEWSWAVGIGDRESGATPRDKHDQIAGVYPWGTQWPPPSGAGNFAGSEILDGDTPATWPFQIGYRDAFPRTAPVGSFPASPLGIFDLGGNVWQLCEDRYDGHSDERTKRASSWTASGEHGMRSSFRGTTGSTGRSVDNGFRCVFEAADAAVAPGVPNQPATIPPTPAEWTDALARVDPAQHALAGAA